MELFTEGLWTIYEQYFIRMYTDTFWRRYGWGIEVEMYAWSIRFRLCFWNHDIEPISRNESLCHSLREFSSISLKFTLWLKMSWTIFFWHLLAVFCTSKTRNTLKSWLWNIYTHFHCCHISLSRHGARQTHDVTIDRQHVFCKMVPTVYAKNTYGL